MKGIGAIAVVVVTVFLLGLGAPFALVRLGALQPPKVAVVATVAPPPTSTPIPKSKPMPTSLPVVTLRAPNGSNIVQMFDSFSGDSAVTRFATGLRCDQLDGPINVTEGGVSMSFYKLDCMGTVGYVNTKWTR